MKEGLYRKGGRNTTSEEVDEFENLVSYYNFLNKQIVSDSIIDFINKVTNRAYEDGKKSKE
jgi:hypothetical protein